MGIYGSIEKRDEPLVQAISMDSGGKAYYDGGTEPDLTIDVAEARGFHDRIRLRFNWSANADWSEEPFLELLLPPAEARRLITYIQRAADYVDRPFDAPNTT